MQEEKKAPFDKKAALKEILRNYTGTDANTQCNRLLAALRQFALTSFEAMRHLDIYHCPARILQLRKRGYKIATHWQTVVTEAGIKHRVGLYVLEQGGGHV